MKQGEKKEKDALEALEKKMIENKQKVDDKVKQDKGGHEKQKNSEREDEVSSKKARKQQKLYFEDGRE